MSELEQEELEKTISEIKQADFISILNPVENSIESKNIADNMRNFVVEKKSMGTCFIVLEKTEEVEEMIGIINAFEEYSDWRGGQVAWVYDLKLNRKIFAAKENRKSSDILRSYLVNINISLLKEVNERGFRNLRWIVYEGDGYIPDHLEEEPELEKKEHAQNSETGIVKSQLLEMGLVVFVDDIMELDF